VPFRHPFFSYRMVRQAWSRYSVRPTMDEQRTGPRRNRQHQWILGGLLFGLAAGLLANGLTAPSAPLAGWRDGLDESVRRVIQPLGGIFLRLLFMTVIPLVFSCLALGVHELGDIKQLGKVGVKTLIVALLLSGISVGIGLVLVNTVRPGSAVSEETRAKLLAEASAKDVDAARTAAEGDAWPKLESFIAAVIPRNPVEAMARAFDGDMLAVLFFAILFGIAIRASGSTRMGAVVGFLEGLYDISFWLVGFALRLAPLGVAALVFSMTARMGFPILRALGSYVLTVLAGLAIQQFVVYPLVLKLACGRSPLDFFLRIRPVMVTAFSTSSSNATLPTTLQVAKEKLRIPPNLANFVLTIGSTFNQNGTALFEGITIIFIAQLFGVPLGLDRQILILAMSVLAGIGTAGIPGGSIPLIVPVLASVGAPPEGIVVILGVDRLLDMCRTVLNVTGDLVAAEFVAKGEREPPGAPES